MKLLRLDENEVVEDQTEETLGHEEVYAVLAGDYARAKEIVLAGIAERGEHPALLYNLACFEARLGEHGAALDHLAAAPTKDERVREWARADEDLASLSGDERFPA